MYTNTAYTYGVRVLSGSGTWSSVSDRDAKGNFAAVDALDVLARLAGVPVQTWNYKAQDPSIRHIGPMAQDFYAAFDIGEDDKHISTVDADGVSLVAIQGLYQMVQEKDVQITALRAENVAQQQTIDDLHERLTALEALVEKLAQGQPAGGGQ